MTGLLAAAEVLAENNFGDTRSGSVAGPMGLLIILLLATATVLLIRNMNARLRRLPERFPDPLGPDPRGPDPRAAGRAAEAAGRSAEGDDPDAPSDNKE